MALLWEKRRRAWRSVGPDLGARVTRRRLADIDGTRPVGLGRYGVWISMADARRRNFTGWCDSIDWIMIYLFIYLFTHTTTSTTKTVAINVEVIMV